mgnify:FL=1
MLEKNCGDENVHQDMKEHKMTGRERQLAAIRHEVPDRIPVDWIAVEKSQAVTTAAGKPDGDINELLGRDGRTISAYRYRGEVAKHPHGKEVSILGCGNGGDYGTTHYYPLAAAQTVAEVDRYGPSPLLPFNPRRNSWSR